MEIRPFIASDTQEIINLVLYCQNNEYQLNIPLSDQPDLLQIDTIYLKAGGNFWVCLINHKIVGCIGLLKKNKTIAVLKKFFVYPEFRGQPLNIGAQLYHQLIDYAKDNQLQQIILDTPANALRSHTFYRKVGFTQLSFKNLPLRYDFPDRDSLFFSLRL